VLLVHGQQNAVDACKGLNYGLTHHALSPRFGWLPASVFARHERLIIEALIREAQRGELPEDKAGNVHWVAQQAATLGESLSRTGKSCYVFFRFFPNVHGPLPLERFVVLPDEEIGAEIEAEAQRWAAKNEKLIAERLRKWKEQSARRQVDVVDVPVAKVQAEVQRWWDKNEKLFTPERWQKLMKRTAAGDSGQPAVETNRNGVAPRNAWFLTQYEAIATDTYRKPAKIHAKWDAMTTMARAEICPDSPNKIAKATVASIIKRAKRKA
jgi:hypothetical protein